MQGRKNDSRSYKIGISQLGEITSTENIGPPGVLGVRRVKDPEP
jgi:hypothetical protein